MHVTTSLPPYLPTSILVRKVVEISLNIQEAE